MLLLPPPARPSRRGFLTFVNIGLTFKSTCWAARAAHREATADYKPTPPADRNPPAPSSNRSDKQASSAVNVNQPWLSVMRPFRETSGKAQSSAIIIPS